MAIDLAQVQMRGIDAAKTEAARHALKRVEAKHLLVGTAIAIAFPLSPSRSIALPGYLKNLWPAQRNKAVRTQGGRIHDAMIGTF